MSGAGSDPSIPGIVTLFTLAGPLVAGVLAPLTFFLAGPLGLLLYPVYLIFWMPSFYILLAPPFCLTGLLYALVARRLQPALAIALAASLAGFAIYFGARLLATGSVAARTPAHIDFAMDTASAFGLFLLVLAATSACWFLNRGRDRLSRTLRIVGWPAPLRRAVRVLGVAVTVVVVGSAIALGRPPATPTAWDRCINGNTLDQEIGDCSTVFDTPTEPAGRRLAAITKRMEAYASLASGGAASERIALYGHAIDDAETAQRLFDADKTDELAVDHLHRGQVEAEIGSFDRAFADFDETIRINGNGILGKQARAEKAQLLMRSR